MKAIFLLFAAAAAVAGCVGSAPEVGEPGAGEATGAPVANLASTESLQTAHQAYLVGGDAAKAAAREAMLRAINARSIGGTKSWEGGGLTGSVETLRASGQCLYLKQEVDGTEGEPTYGWACPNDDGLWFQCGIGPGMSDPGSGPECGDP